MQMRAMVRMALVVSLAVVGGYGCSWLEEGCPDASAGMPTAMAADYPATPCSECEDC